MPGSAAQACFDEAFALFDAGDVEAARDAQFANLTLIEEPIACFYAWMAAQHRPGRRHERLENGQVALVCDVRLDDLP